MSEEPRGEPQYREIIRAMRAQGPAALGLSAGWAYLQDPRHLVFTLARYKFVAKMFEGFESVLEIGCGDGFASRIVAQAVGRLSGIDFDPAFIDDAKGRTHDRWAIDFTCHDILEAPFPGSYRGMYALDVLEHIAPSEEDRFLRNATASLEPYGAFVVGTPSLESQAYASPVSKEGHVNCKSMPELRATMLRYFHNAFMFSMNDEVVHTGYHHMAHYLFAVCSGKRENSAPG